MENKIKVHCHYLEDIPPKSDPGHIRIVCLSDTHTRQTLETFPTIPDGDILIHAGDFTQNSGDTEFEHFKAHFEKLPHKHKFVIAGNHDYTCDEKYYATLTKRSTKTTAELKEFLSSFITYVEDATVEVEGIKIYFSPWTKGSQAFGYKDDKVGEQIWSKIPKDTHILVTHSPPHGILDEALIGRPLGCEILRRHVDKVKPLVHVFGHVHEGYGSKQEEVEVVVGKGEEERGEDGGKTLFLNVSICDKFRKPTHKPIVFDLVKL
eukprot:TRINITY_DN10413_c0_g1_i1.p1 TRINITY_DN10413_c0_g1~~TRINITY_DN10413_c0_g1_i1.p1  ORF type:complete len:264 (+),score=36.20 TRINITY_DN10413_c0_g1_i1:121-912(+)